MNESLLVTMNQCVDRIQGTCAQYRTIRLPKQQGNREVSFPSNRKKRNKQYINKNRETRM